MKDVHDKECVAVTPPMASTFQQVLLEERAQRLGRSQAQCMQQVSSVARVKSFDKCNNLRQASSSWGKASKVSRQNTPDILTVRVALQRSSTSVDHARNLVLVFCASSRQESRRRRHLQVGTEGLPWKAHAGAVQVYRRWKLGVDGINCISLPDVSVSGMGACQRAGRQLLQHMLWGIIHVQKQ